MINFISIPLLYFLSVTDYLVITGFIFLFATIYFMYLFLKNEGFNMTLSLSGATIWTFNGVFLFHVQASDQFQTIFMLIPLILMLIKILSARRFNFTIWVLLVIVNAIALSTALWDIFEYIVWIGSLYILIAIPDYCDDYKSNLINRFKLLSIYGLSIILAFTLIAPFTFNLLDLIINSYRASANFDVITEYLRIEDFFTMFLSGIELSRYGSRFYIPIIIIPFVLISLIKINRIKVFAITLIILFPIYAYPTGFYDLISQLPLHGTQVKLYRSFIFIAFGLSLLFTYGLRDYIYGYNKKSDIILFIIILIFSLLIFIPILMLLIEKNYIYVLNFFSILICLLTFIPCLLFKDRLYLNKIFARGLPLIIILFTLFFSYLFNVSKVSSDDSSLDKKLNNESISYIAKLRELSKGESFNHRVQFTEGFPPLFAVLNYFESIDFFYKLPSKDLGLVVTKILDNERCYSFLEYKPPENKFYSIASVKYIVYKGHNYSINKNQNLVYNDDHVRIVENLDVFNRIRFMDSFKVISSLEQNINFIADNQIEWFKNNYTIDKDPIIRSPNSNFNPTYDVLLNTPQHLMFSVESNSETMMIINNHYDEGWKLRVNGQSQPIYRVNGYFQGIKIIPGTHQYDIYYLPKNFYKNLLISIFSIIGVCLVGLYEKIRKLVVNKLKGSLL